MDHVVVAEPINAARRLHHFAAAAAHRSRLWLRRRPLRLQFRCRLRQKRFPLAVRHPRPLQRLVYAVQVDGSRRTDDNIAAADVGKSKSLRAAAAPPGAAASMALRSERLEFRRGEAGGVAVVDGVLPVHLVRGRAFVVIVIIVVVAMAVTVASHRAHLFCQGN